MYFVNELNIMNLEQLLALFYTPIYKSNRYITTYEHDSLIADTVKNVIYWNSINKTFTPIEFLKFHGVDDDEIEAFGLEANIKLNINSIVDLEYQQYLFYGTVNNSFNYFVERGLNEETVAYFKLEVKSNAIIIPYIVNDKRVGAIYRFMTNNKQRRYVIYSNEKINYWPHISYYETTAKTALLFEGYFSVMRWMQYFRNNNKNIHCYNLLNARPTLNKLTAFEKYAKVYYIADADNPGILAAQKIKQLASWITCLIPNKMPDEMSTDEMQNVLKLKTVRKL